MIPERLLDEGPALVFDLWQTLAFDTLPENPFDAVVRGFGFDPAAPAERARVEAPLMSRPYRDLDEALDHLQELLGRSVEGRDRLRALWQESARTATLYKDVLPALVTLAERFPLALLSNTQSFGMESIQASGLLEHFDALVLSYQQGLAKPDPAFFTAAARELALPAERLVMIGDSIERDMVPARAAGFGGVVLIDRSPAPREPDAAQPVIRSLDELLAALG